MSTQACIECGNDDPCEGYQFCSDCLELSSTSKRPPSKACTECGELKLREMMKVVIDGEISYKQYQCDGCLVVIYAKGMAA